ncbi:hypothetical protein KO361_03825 [Candidatus Woesearchaeota archaeon]|nr:hypothetical protein [Candidatus Woesearchaeota archaeon]
MIKKTKAQAGNHAAILVIIITGLLVLFVLSISPEEREKLLNDETTTNGEDPLFPGSTTLIRAVPGQVKYSPETEIIHEFSPFNLNAEVKGELIHTKNSMYLKNSAFEKITDTITFKINPETTNNILLNFNVEQSSGSLIIHLNGETIYNAPIRPGNSPPINIAPSLLRQENTLQFQVSGPGAAFWRYNHYTIKDINLYGDITDLTRSKATQVFNIATKEANELKASNIRYLPACKPETTKNLRVHINNFEIFSGIPDCEVFNTIQIPINYLYEGINDITFQIEEGRVLIDRAIIQNSLEKPYTLTYYFEVQDKYFNFVNDEYELKNNYETMLDITFPNNNQKRFELTINGKPISFNTARLRETRSMQFFLQPGTNSIQINPKSELTITEIRIRIREK